MKALEASQGALVVKNLPANAEETRDAGLIPGLGRSPEGGHSNPLQYSCLENPMDRRDWWATVHVVTDSDTEVTCHTCTLAHMKATHTGIPVYKASISG